MSSWKNGKNHRRAGGMEHKVRKVRGGVLSVFRDRGARCAEYAFMPTNGRVRVVAKVCSGGTRAAMRAATRWNRERLAK